MTDDLTSDPPSSLRAPEILRRTLPWARFVAALMLLGGGLTVIGGLLAGIALSTGAAMGGVRDNSSSDEVVPGLIMGIVYASFGLVYLIPGIFLWRFASRARVYCTESTMDRLEHALEAQRSYWKSMGIMAIVGLGCFLGLFGFALFSMFAANWLR